jgi:hypothetical protein
MKKIISKYLSLLLLTVMFATVSCDKWIDPEINNNPDVLTNVPLNLILPNIQGGYGYISGGMDLTGNVGIWMNYFAGVDRQALAINSYIQSSDDINNLWNSCYAGIMTDCKKMIEQANLPGAVSPHYAGVGKVMLAATLGMVTSVWGDVPYSEAFSTVNLSPAYDSQESIYQTINTLLDEAIADFAVPAAENYYPLQNDLIGGGNLTKWTRVAYSLKARFAMHLSKKGETAAASTVLTALNNGLTGNSDNAVVAFPGSSESSQNPMYQFVTQRSNYIQLDTEFQTLLSGDPRAGLLANTTLTSNAYIMANSSVGLIKYSEVCFLRAEALLIQATPDAAAAATAYNAGLTAHLNELGVFDQTWYDANALTAGTITRALVLRAKYIALAGSYEIYNDWRRTGFPTLTINTPNENSNQLPVRFLYPTNEITYNKNCPTGVTINNKTWAFQ